MMGEHLRRLVSIAGPELGAPMAEPPALGSTRLERELAGLLSAVNGFYAFESALHVFPAKPASQAMSLQDWNDDALWRAEYGDLAAGHLFFAEDVFGGQFSISGETVCSFDPETGQSDQVADTVEGWAGLVLQDYEMQTGHPLAHDWQVRHKALPDRIRLIPKIPFVLGGDFTMENLYALDSVKGMRLRAELASQLRDLPDGTTIDFKVAD